MDSDCPAEVSVEAEVYQTPKKQIVILSGRIFNLLSLLQPFYLEVSSRNTQFMCICMYLIGQCSALLYNSALQYNTQLNLFFFFAGWTCIVVLQQHPASAPLLHRRTGSIQMNEAGLEPVWTWPRALQNKRSPLIHFCVRPLALQGSSKKCEIASAVSTKPSGAILLDNVSISSVTVSALDRREQDCYCSNLKTCKILSRQRL